MPAHVFSAPSSQGRPFASLSRDRLARIRHVALDMDGTIYKGRTLFPCTLPFLDRMKRLGIGYTFLTNNPSKSIPDYLGHLHRMGLDAKREELHTSAQATIEYVREHFPAARRLFILGTPSMIAEFESAGYSPTGDSAGDVPDAVVVGFDTTLIFSRLGRAAWWIRQGKPFVATNPDRVCPTDEPTVLVDCGSICAALEQAAGRGPDAVLGKPDPTMLSGILRRHALQAGEVAMVGDRIYTDVLMAKRAGALGVLVLSGECTAGDAENATTPPDLVVPTLAEFGELLEEARVS